MILPSGECRRNSSVWLKVKCVDKANKTRLRWQRPLRDRKTNLRLIIYSHSSASPDNLAEIANVEIIGRTGIVKYISAIINLVKS